MPDPVENYRFQNFRVDVRERLVYRDDKPISLTPKAFQTLLVLVQRPGRLVTKEELFRLVWPDTVVEETSLTQNIWVLRRALGQRPEGPTFIETVPKFGYRFVADTSTPAADSPPIEDAPPAREPNRRRLRAIPAILLVAGALALLWTRAPWSSRAAVRPSAAVLEFQNLSGDRDLAWFSTALAEMLSTELGAGPGLRMISTRRVAQLQPSLAEALAKDDVSRLSRALGCDYILSGSYLRVAGRVRVDLRLQDAASGEMIDTTSQTDDEANLLRLVAVLGAHLRARLGVAQPSTRQETVARGAVPANPEALRRYAEGLTLLRRFDATAAQQVLSRAVEADPRFPLAHSALSEAWSRLGYDEKAALEAKLAFDLSRNLSHEDGLVVEGRYRQARSEWTRAASIYRTLWDFFPDNIEYGLLLASVQTSGGQGKLALESIRSLRALKAAATDARADLAEADAASALADYTRGLNAAQRALHLAQQQQVRPLEAIARLSEGNFYQLLTEPDKARASFDAARAICATLGDQACVADAMNHEGAMARGSGDLDRATTLLQEALTIDRRIGDRRATAGALAALASVLRSRADMEGARVLFEEALAIGREVSDRRGTTFSLINLGNVLNNTGQPGPAKQRYREALDIARVTGDRSQIAISMGNLAGIAYAEGDLRGARKTLEEVLDLKRKIGDRSSIAYTLSRIGNVYLAQGDIGAARAAWKEQCQIQSAAGEKIVLANCELGLAELDLEEGRPDAVISPARRIGQQFSTVNPSADAWKLLAEASLMRGDLQQAREAAANAVRIAKASPNLADYRLPVAITAARVAGASGKIPEALRDLRDVLARAGSLNLVGLQLEARLAICEIQKDRSATAGFIADADRLGYRLLAARARRIPGAY